MSMETLNTSVSSLIEEDLFAGEMETEELLLRRLSPYATLRPGDLSVLLGLQRQVGGDRSCRKLATSLFDNANTIAERSDSDGESDKEPEPEARDVVVRGQDVGDLPAQYVVRGLRPYELPVIGVFVDPRILPGFRYRVRRVGTDTFLFDGKALPLLSIGLGYGKRLTFAGDSLNFNDNYFWSDSDPNGYAFSLDAVQAEDKLTAYASDESGVIGEVKVERICSMQEEISSEVVNGDVIKRVQVTLDCSVTYCQSHHRMVNLKLHDMERLSGQALIIKKRRSRVAHLDSIQNVSLACIPGTCTLQVTP